MPDEVPRRVFDGLLLAEGCTPTPMMLAEFVAAGFDVDGPDGAFPAKTWRDVAEIVRRHVLPALPRDQGMLELGRRFTAGFARTTVGRVFRGVAPAFGPDLTLQAVPRYLYTVRKRMQVTMTHEGDRRYRLRASDSSPDPWFIAGCLVGLLDMFKLRARADVVNVQAEQFEIELSWES